MNRMYRSSLALIFPVLFAAQMIRAQEHPPRVEEAKSRAASSPRVAPAPLLLFGAIPVSTRSVEARKFAELSLDKYENVLLHDAVIQAQHATEKDPNFALGYALLSFASRTGIPNIAALERAKALLPQAPPDEQLLVRWMTGIQDAQSPSRHCQHERPLEALSEEQARFVPHFGVAVRAARLRSVSKDDGIFVADRSQVCASAE